MQFRICRLPLLQRDSIRLMHFPKQILETIEGIAGRFLGAAFAVGAVLICFFQIDDILKLNLLAQIASWLLVVLVCLMEGMYFVLLLTTRSAEGHSLDSRSCIETATVAQASSSNRGCILDGAFSVHNCSNLYAARVVGNSVLIGQLDGRIFFGVSARFSCLWIPAFDSHGSY